MRRGGDRNRGGGHEGGALFPFSGALALLGQESYRGLELAVNEINAAGGINGEDPDRQGRRGRPDPGRVRNQAPDLVQRDRRVRQLRVRHFLRRLAGHRAGGRALLELGATAHKITTRGYKYLFRSNPNTALYGVSVVNALHETIAPGMGLNPKDIKIGIIHETAPAPTWPPPEKRAQELGYTVAEVLPYSAKTVDLSRSSCA